MYHNISTCIEQSLDISGFDAIHCCFFVTNSTFGDFVADVGIAYILERLYRIHQIQLLCDHQELAYTPKDPP